MIILGKKIVGRVETLEYANKKFKWPCHAIIGVSCFYGFLAWFRAKTFGYKMKCIYYCIDFYDPEVFTGWWDKIFIPAAILMDRFLCKVCDEVWDISERINEGRQKFGGYRAKSRIVPLSYPPNYFQFRDDVDKDRIAYVGLEPYGMELYKEIGSFIWFGGKERLPLKTLLYHLSRCGIGVSMWEKNGNNWYGDPGKTKLYSACGLPVIMTGNTPYAKVIKETHAGLVIDYSEKSLRWAIKKILGNYNHYKNNVRKTWRYINADEVFKNIEVKEL